MKKFKSNIRYRGNTMTGPCSLFAYGLCFLLMCSSVRSTAQNYKPGNSYIDSTGFIEYIAGNLPIIISAPHGGYLEPDSIPDCTDCSMLRDAYTQEIGRGISEAFFKKTGCYPHVIINLLHKVKLNANRALTDETEGVPVLEKAWHAYHRFIDSSKATVTLDYGKGLYIDLHGHGHDIQRIEMGYLLSKSDLQSSDGTLNTADIIQKSSIRHLAESNLKSLPHASLIRGDFSLGTIMGDQNFPTIPSTDDIAPLGDDPYFTGGYNTRRHGSRNGGAIDGIQLEFNQSIRFDEDMRAELIDSLTMALSKYIDLHYISTFLENPCNLVSNNSNPRLDPVQIYPNPTDGYFTVKGVSKDAELILYDMYGKIINTIDWNGSSVDISTLENGSYILVVKNEISVQSKKILLIR